MNAIEELSTYRVLKTTYTLGRPLSHDVLFFLLLEVQVTHLVSAQRPMELVKNALQTLHFANDESPKSVDVWIL